jgi:hypothetical protein
MFGLENSTTEFMLTLICAFLASGGFWAYLTKRQDRNSDTTKLLMGLAHDLILTRGTTYMSRGYITNEEFNDLDVYLIRPYLGLGGNGMAERILNEIKKLPIHDPDFAQGAKND